MQIGRADEIDRLIFAQIRLHTPLAKALQRHRANEAAPQLCILQGHTGTKCVQKAGRGGVRRSSRLWRLPRPHGQQNPEPGQGRVARQWKPALWRKCAEAGVTGSETLAATSADTVQTRSLLMMPAVARGSSHSHSALGTFRRSVPAPGAPGPRMPGRAMSSVKYVRVVSASTSPPGPATTSLWSLMEQPSSGLPWVSCLVLSGLTPPILFSLLTFLSTCREAAMDWCVVVTPSPAPCAGLVGSPLPVSTIEYQCPLPMWWENRNLGVLHTLHIEQKIAGEMLRPQISILIKPKRSHFCKPSSGLQLNPVTAAQRGKLSRYLRTVFLLIETKLSCQLLRVTYALNIKYIFKPHKTAIGGGQNSLLLAISATLYGWT